MLQCIAKPYIDIANSQEFATFTIVQGDNLASYMLL